MHTYVNIDNEKNKEKTSVTLEQSAAGWVLRQRRHNSDTCERFASSDESRNFTRRTIKPSVAAMYT